MKVDREFLARYWGLVGMEKGMARLGEEIIYRMAKFGYWELEKLLEEGLIYELDIKENKRRKRTERKYYGLTEKGKKFIEENLEKYNEMLIQYSKENAVKILKRFKQFGFTNIDKLFEYYDIEKALTVSMGKYILLFLKNKENKEQKVIWMKRDGYSWEIRTFNIDVTEDVKNWITQILPSSPEARA